MLPRSKLFLSLLGKRCIQHYKYSIKIGEKPLGSIFFHPKVQFLMKKLTIVDYEKLFEPRKFGQPALPPKYTFMTDEELEEERKIVQTKAEKMLQMPPLIDVTEEKIETLSNDSSLDGHDEHHSKYVFTDISFDLKPYERLVVVREPNGLLRTATKKEKERMNQVFFPINGRKLSPPKMFQPEHFKDVLARGEYEFILNSACIQFNPEDEEYHKVIAETFDYINEKGEFDKLIKTRYFGPFALYLAVNNKINNMLQFFLMRGDLIEASYLVDILHIVQTESPWSLAEATESDENFEKHFSFDEACKSVKDYISHNSKPGSELESYFNASVQKFRDEQELKIESSKAQEL